jgi:hypothetical protein
LAEEQVQIDSLPIEQFKAAREAGATTTIAKSAVEDSTLPEITGKEDIKEFKQKREEQQQGHKNGGAGFLKRIDRLTKQRSIVEGEREAARVEAASLKERLARYEGQTNGNNSDGAEPQEQSQEESYSGRSEQRTGPVEDDPKFQALRQRYADFDDVMERAQKEGMRIHDAAAKVLHSLEHGGDIAYRLALDDEARNDFNKLSPARQIEEIRRADAERGKLARVQPFLDQIKQTFSPDEISEVVKAEKENQVGANLAFSMTQELASLPNGPNVWRHIVKDTQISKRLNQMSPSQRTLELGRISARLEVHERPVSSLPTPITPVGRGSSRTSAVPLDEMDMKSFKAARNAGRVG